MQSRLARALFIWRLKCYDTEVYILLLQQSMTNYQGIENHSTHQKIMIRPELYSKDPVNASGEIRELIKEIARIVQLPEWVLRGET